MLRSFERLTLDMETVRPMEQCRRESRTDLCRTKATNYIRHFLSLHRSLRLRLLRRHLGLLLGFRHDLWLSSYRKSIVINPGRIKQRYSTGLAVLLRALLSPSSGWLVSLLILNNSNGFVMRGALRNWGATRACFRYGNLARLTDAKRKTS